MSKKPSAETQLRHMRRDLRLSRLDARAEHELRVTAVRDYLASRGKLTQVQQDAADWRKRFDDLRTFTPGPWRWEVNLKSKQIILAGGSPRYDLDVMDFVRWGMGGARPRLLKRWDRDGLMLMENADTFATVVAGREHHASWFQTLAHPDARLIAAAPGMYALLDESQNFIGGDWRQRRDALLIEIDGGRR